MFSMKDIDFTLIQALPGFHHFNNDTVTIQPLNSLSNKVFLLTHHTNPNEKLIYRLYNSIFNLYINRDFENTVASKVKSPQVFYCNQHLRIEAYVEGHPFASTSVIVSTQNEHLFSIARHLAQFHSIPPHSPT